MAIFWSLFIIATISLYLYLKYIYSYWKKRGLVQAEPTFLLGNWKNVVFQKVSIGENILDMYKKLKAPGRKCGGTYLFTKPELLILDPELVKTIFTQDFQYFTDRRVNFDEETDPLSGHLFALKGSNWRNMRQKLTPVFTSGKIKMMFNIHVECSKGLYEIIENYAKNSEPIDIKEIICRFTTDIIASCAFGFECNSFKEPENDFWKWGKLSLTQSKYAFFHQILYLCFPSFHKRLAIKQIDPGVTDFFMSIVKDTIHNRETNNVRRNDLLQLLINVRNSVYNDEENVNGENNNGTSKKLPQEKSLTIEQMAAQCFIFFLAGYQPSSAVLSFIFYDMATHQDIQDKLREEINTVLKKYDGQLTYEGVFEMHYLDKVINESIRLHSAIPMVTRVCTKNYNVPNMDVVIEEGTAVIIPIIGFHSDAEYHPDPEKFDPERFSPEQKQNRHPFTSIQFGYGPRSCIGSRFGLLQTKIGIIVSFKNVRYTLNDKTKVPLVMEPKNLIFSVKGGIWLNAEIIEQEPI